MVFWATLAFASSLLDVLFSYRRIEKYGQQIEMNPAVRWLAQRIDPLLGTLVGVMVPSWLLIGLLLAVDWESGMAAYAGARLMLNWEQIASLRLEKIWDELLKGQSGKAD